MRRPKTGALGPYCSNKCTKEGKRKAQGIQPRPLMRDPATGERTPRSTDYLHHPDADRLLLEAGPLAGLDDEACLPVECKTPSQMHLETQEALWRKREISIPEHQNDKEDDDASSFSWSIHTFMSRSSTASVGPEDARLTKEFAMNPADLIAEEDELDYIAAWVTAWNMGLDGLVREDPRDSYLALRV